MNDISKKTFLWCIAVLVILRFAMVFLLMNNIPFTDMQMDGFRPNFSGSYWPDEVNYFNLGQSFVKLSPIANVANIGYPLFLAPIIYLTGATDIIGITRSVFVIQAFLFFSLAIVLVALISLEILKKKKLAIFSAFIFTICPFILFGILKLANFPRAIPVFHYQMWISIAADYLSAILVYSGFYLFIKKFNRNNLGFIGVVLIGALISAAALVRVANILYLPLIFLILIWLKKYKESFVFGLASFLIYLPQWIYNFHFFGSPLVYGYRVPSIGFDAGTKVLGDWISLDNVFLFFDKIWQNLPAFIWILPILVLIAVAGFWKLFKQNKVLSLILVFWVSLNVVFYIFFIAAQSQ
ncbi:MAG: hypothetical protein V1732_01110, partial [Patescibacteria group bacterium]